MRKVKLSLDDLSVHTFSTADAPARGGTVRAHSVAYATHEYASCYVTDCGGASCAYQCTGTGSGGTGGTQNTQCGQYTCATPDSTCPF